MSNVLIVRIFYICMNHAADHLLFTGFNLQLGGRRGFHCQLSNRKNEKKIANQSKMEKGPITLFLALKLSATMICQRRWKMVRAIQSNDRHDKRVEIARTSLHVGGTTRSLRRSQPFSIYPSFFKKLQGYFF